MDTLSWLLFESIALPATLAGVGSIVLLFIGQRMEPRRRGKMWLIWMCIVVGLFMMQKLVTTDRERVRMSLDTLARAVTDKDMNRFAAQLAPEFSSDGMDKKAFVEFARGRINDVTIDPPTFTRCDIAIEGDTATIELTARNLVQYQGFGVPWASQWTIHWKRGPEGWQVTQIIPRGWGGHEIRSLQDLHP